uniref:Mannose-1-phosphate guanyltransferase n=1 Tax=Bionectria ochroleuca TaxID=29856 RepID=A0A0B7K9L7_BIOOC
MSLQVPHRPKEGSTKAVILVGGPSRGTRFRPLSLDVPKPLFEVAGHPIIWHCISAIAAVGSIHDVYIIGYYDESVFRDFIKDASKEFPVLSSIKYLREYEALGTAGGLYHFRDAILKGRPERLFVLNADAATNFGCIVSDAHTKRVLHYVEKPESRISNLINCGRRLDRPARLLSYPSSDNLETSYLHAQAADDDDDDEEGRKTEVIRLEQDILGDMADSKQFFGTPIPVTTHSTSIIKNGVKVQSITILGKDCGVGDEVRVQNCVCLPYKELKRDVANEVIM